MRKFVSYSLSVFILCLTFFAPTTIQAKEIITDGKLITVDLGKQLLTAWESGRVVHQTKISSGLLLAPTVMGSFRIQTKVPSQDMKGGSKAYGPYFLKNVPNIMYFYQGYAIHGAYWHNRFGRPASHGCVNTPLASADWLYKWAPVGTRVEVY